MICEFINGPKDGEITELPGSPGVGFVHGVMMAHSPELHPFSKEEALIDIVLPSRSPAFVALYRLAAEGRLEFLTYVKKPGSF